MLNRLEGGDEINAVVWDKCQCLSISNPEFNRFSMAVIGIGVFDAEVT